MISVQHEDGLTVLGIFGAFELADYKRLEQEVREQLARRGQLNVLLDLRDMLSVTVDVALEDLRFTREHAKDIGRIAILSERDSVAWTAFLSQWLVEARIRVFDDETTAREWLVSASGSE